MNNLSDPLRLAAQRWPDRDCLVYEDRRYTYAEFAACVGSRVQWLRAAGVGPGDTVLTIGPNSDELLATYLALAALGAVNVPMNTMLTVQEATSIAERSGAVAVICDTALQQLADDLRGRVDGIRAWLPLQADLNQDLATLEPSTAGGGDQAMIIYTSGSTGSPKGCIKSHDNLIWHTMNSQIGLPRVADDRELYAIPLAGIGLVNFALVGMLVGACVVLARFNAAKLLPLVSSERISVMFLPPTMLHAVLESPEGADHDASSLHTIYTGYEISERLRSSIWKRFGPILRFGYGSSEGTFSYALAEEFMAVPDRVGRVCGLDEVQVMDADGRLLLAGETGEIVGRGPSIFAGYLGDAGLTRATLVDGWYHTGDLGSLDGQARLHFAGRLKDMIKSGGMNVAAAEVEQAIARHPGVQSVAVVGLPDDRWGEVVVAAVVTRSSSFTEAALREFVSQSLAGYKRPKHYVIVDQLPINPTGKVAKGTLRDQVSKQLRSTQ